MTNAEKTLDKSSMIKVLERIGQAGTYTNIIKVYMTNPQPILCYMEKSQMNPIKITRDTGCSLLLLFSMYCLKTSKNNKISNGN